MAIKIVPTGIEVQNEDGSFSNVPMELETEGSKTAFKATLPDGFTIEGEFSEKVEIEGETQ